MQDTLRLEIVVSRAAAQFRQLPTGVRRLLQLCDGTRTLEALCSAGALSAADTRKAVTRLMQLGLVTMRPDEKKKRKPLSEKALAWVRNESGFSNDEEEFFSSSIEHLIEA